ncbi:MAG: DUF389 domain-containing protein [Myxococcota bacterium]
MPTPVPDPRPDEPVRSLREEVRARFDLAADQADPEVIDVSIRAGVPFRGTNLWLLIFAIVIASVGLNVNSTAVIIGAMLISPLMGPIMGVGYGAAVADFRLVRLAFANLLVATGVSIAASAAYFALTPLAEAHSELLARTSPTIWDVLIALFGGLAGIVGATRREKSNVVPGVAIATALMPPLCTAGYGLATGNAAYFAGAFYLFFINSVFIAAATFVMVRVMGLPEVAYVDAAASRRAHRWIALVVVATALPSVFLAQRLVAKEVFESRASSFLAAAFPVESPTFVVARDLDAHKALVRVTVVGTPITPDRRAALEALLPSHGLAGATLRIDQAEQPTVDVAAIREHVAGELVQRTLAELRARDDTIARLEAEVAAARASAARFDGLEAEIVAQHPGVGGVVVAASGDAPETRLVVGLGSRKPLGAATRERVRAWLLVRTRAREVWVFEDPALAELPATQTEGAGAVGASASP